LASVLGDRPEKMQSDDARTSAGEESPDSPAVVHLLTGKLRGGVEEHSLSLLARLHEFGFEPWMAAPPALLRAMERDLEAAGVGRLALEFSSPLDLAAGAHLARFVRRRRVALLHTQSFAASLAGAAVARMSGVGAVLETSHGPEVWRMGRRWRGSFWIDRQVARLVDLFIAVSHAAARHLIDRKHIPPSKIRVIHNGRDFSSYRPLGPEARARIRAALGVSDGPVLLSVARLDEQKGHRYLLDAVSRLSARWPALVLLLAGEGPLEPILREQAARLGIERRVRFLGYRADIPELLHAADVVVLASLYEGLPLVAIETLAAERPLVATAVDGTPEVVIDAETGLLTAPGDAAALAAALERMLDDPAMGVRLASAGREFVRENFALERQIEQTIAVYRELTGSIAEGAREPKRAAAV
jgi:glycosyltransferase involved in cell wall biosynthesis